MSSGLSSTSGALINLIFFCNAASSGLTFRFPLISQACAAASRCIAATRSVKLQIRSASRAAIVPILTLSWLCDSVERENDAAGIVPFKASAVSADEEMDIALNP